METVRKAVQITLAGALLVLAGVGLLKLVGEAIADGVWGPTEEIPTYSIVERESPDVAVQSSGERVCPQCNAPLDRVHRRIVDRLASWFTPVYRYRCRMKGWGCDWEGNLRTK